VAKIFKKRSSAVSVIPIVLRMTCGMLGKYQTGFVWLVRCNARSDSTGRVNERNAPKLYLPVAYVTLRYVLIVPGQCCPIYYPIVTIEHDRPKFSSSRSQ